MNKRIDLTNLGGLPFTQYTLNWLQESERNGFFALANLIGEKAIASGVVVGGGVVTNGYVVINGELMPFEGGAVAAMVKVVETGTSRVFQDAATHVVYYEKKCILVSVAGDFNFSELIRVESLINTWLPGDTKEVVCDMPYLVANFDVDGYGLNTRVGWRILSKAFPDTAGKVMVNYDETDAAFNTLGNFGGAKEHTLTRAQLPNDQLRIKKPGGGEFVNDTGGGGGNISLKGDGDNSLANGYILTEPMGSGLSHNNLQPYFVVLKLIKL